MPRTQTCLGWVRSFKTVWVRNVFGSGASRRSFKVSVQTPSLHAPVTRKPHPVSLLHSATPCILQKATGACRPASK